MFATGAVSADDAHVFCIGEGVRGRVLGGGGARAPGEAHEGGGGGARGLEHAPRPHRGQQARLWLDVQGARGTAE